MTVTCVDAVFPATSVAVPLITCRAPSADTVCCDGQVAIPERLSAQVNVTVTGVVFHPFGAGVGDATAVIVGGVLSRFIVAQAVAVSPELSVAWPQMDWPAPSELTTTGEAQLATWYDPAEQLNVSVGFELFQPLALGAGVTEATVMEGGIG